MTGQSPRNAAEELAVWELAMKTLRAVERQLEAARRKSSLATFYPLHAQVEALRTRADLLLVDAVGAMHDSHSESQMEKESGNPPLLWAVSLPTKAR
jgi:hypothetical protein